MEIMDVKIRPFDECPYWKGYVKCVMVCQCNYNPIRNSLHVPLSDQRFTWENNHKLCMDVDISLQEIHLSFSLECYIWFALYQILKGEFDLSEDFILNQAKSLVVDKIFIIWIRTFNMYFHCIFNSYLSLF